jgi:gamma-D-glutamyl-L-lysine dipeptidyl-peptidase
MRNLSHALAAAILSGLLCFTLASAQTEGPKMITEVLKEAKEKLAPDRRTAVFDVQARKRGKTVVIAGEVHNAAMKQALLDLLKKHRITRFKDSIVALPQPSLGEKLFGVVSVSVANIRTDSKHSAEMGTQALLGTPVRILKKEHGWIYVQTPDDYLGWSDDNIVEMTQIEYAAWVARPRIIVTADYASIRDFRTVGSQQVSDAVAGCIMALRNDAGSDYEVEFPDGRSGFILKEDAFRLETFLAGATASPASVVATAKRFVGLPYFWGGTSAKAVDCSGFSKTVYFLNGIQLPRDASQQALVGDLVDTTGGINLQPGDLLFFGFKPKGERKERVTHVGISLGGKRFIHSSGQVRFNSLDPNDSDFSAYRDNMFLRARRIIGAPESSGIRFLANIPYYSGKP